MGEEREYGRDMGDGVVEYVGTKPMRRLGPFPDGAPGSSGASGMRVHKPRRGKNLNDFFQFWS
jgi:hypothetical protein